ncbi:hypothetical protein LTR85_010329 [Meristemomyces frigidus]|nr:hypothetical protein LTR85_010329 [Meristemomyces frigidus]
MADVDESHPHTDRPTDSRKQETNPAAMTERVSAESLLDGTIFARYLPTCTFVIGAETTSFTVHTNLLRERRPKLAEAFDTSMGGAIQGDAVVASSPAKITDDIVLLPDVDLGPFCIFLVWLYTGHLAPPSASLRGGEAQIASPSSQERLVKKKKGKLEFPDFDLVRPYTFAVTYDLPDLGNLSITALAKQNQKRRTTATKSAVHYVFEAGESCEKLCMMFADEAVLRLTPTTLSESLPGFHAAYILAVMRSVLSDKAKLEAEKKSEAQWKNRVCAFHVHADESKATECQEALLLPYKTSDFALDMHNFLDSTVTVVVGFEQVRFTVHKGLICRYGDFFRGAFEGNFKEGEEQEVELKQESVKDFAIFLHWLYARAIHLPDGREHKALSHLLRPGASNITGGANTEHDAAGDVKEAARSGDTAVSIAASSADACGPSSKPDDGEYSQTADHADEEADADADSDQDEPEWKWQNAAQDSLVVLFVFADRRGGSQLRNKIMSLLASQRESDWWLLSEDCDRGGIAYSCLPTEPALSRYLVDEAACFWYNDFNEMENLAEYPTEFIVEVLKAVLSARIGMNNPKPVWRADMCVLHDHADEQEEKACKAALKDFR